MKQRKKGWGTLKLRDCERELETKQAVGQKENTQLLFLVFLGWMVVGNPGVHPRLAFLFGMVQKYRNWEPRHICLSHKTYSPKDEPMFQLVNYIKYDIISFVYLGKLYINSYERFELEVLRLLEIMHHCLGLQPVARLVSNHYGSHRVPQTLAVGKTCLHSSILPSLTHCSQASSVPVGYSMDFSE